MGSNEGGDQLGLRGLLADVLVIGTARATVEKTSIGRTCVSHFRNAAGERVESKERLDSGRRTWVTTLDAFAHVILEEEAEERRRNPLAVFLKAAGEGIRAEAILADGLEIPRDEVRLILPYSRPVKIVREELSLPQAFAGALELMTDMGNACPEQLMANMVSLRKKTDVEIAGRAGFRNAANDEMGVIGSQGDGIEWSTVVFEVPVFRVSIDEQITPCRVPTFCRLDKGYKKGAVCFETLDPDFWDKFDAATCDVVGQCIVKRLNDLVGDASTERPRFAEAGDGGAASEARIIRLIQGSLPIAV